MTQKSLDTRRKKLIYRCTHRGTKESDRVLGEFVREHAARFSDDELSQMERLMDEADQDIFYWLSGRNAFPDYINPSLRQKILDQVS